MGEACKDALRLDFDRRVKAEFHGTKGTSDAGMLAYRELDKEAQMNRQVLLKIVLTLLFSAVVCNASVQAKWNDECPCSFAQEVDKGKALQKEIPDFHRDFRLQLTWQGGEPCHDPNAELGKEIKLAETVTRSLLKDIFIPEDLDKDRFLLLSNLPFKGGARDAIVLRFSKNGYIFKIMKTRMHVFITLRPLSRKPVDVQQISKKVFRTKILPAAWQKPLYHGNLKRKSKVMQAGMWLPQDCWFINDKGHMVTRDRHLPRLFGPIGKGLYKRLDFYTDGKFITYKLISGPACRSATTKDK